MFQLVKSKRVKAVTYKSCQCHLDFFLNYKTLEKVAAKNGVSMHCLNLPPCGHIDLSLFIQTLINCES